MRTYLTNLIEEKGRSLEDAIDLDGHFGLTYGMLVNFIVDEVPAYNQAVIRNTLVAIDFQAGDVFHYLNHLAAGMVAACGY